MKKVLIAQLILTWLTLVLATDSEYFCWVQVARCFHGYPPSDA